jgi:uncharacterized glyoxalase superfamily protein PhnB
MDEKQASGGRLNRVVPYFLVEDVVATAEFYRAVLGFTSCEFFGDPPSFTIVTRDDVRLMFRQAPPSKTRVARPNPTVMDGTFDAYVYVSNVDDLATEMRATQADVIEGPINRIYGMRELLVRDCNGYVLAFGQG